MVPPALGWPHRRRAMSAIRGVATSAGSGVASSTPGVAAALAAGFVISWAYDGCVRMHARIVLGAAATKQLVMQRLEGTVELELRYRPLSSTAELRGQLTPLLGAPRAYLGFPRHSSYNSSCEASCDSERHSISNRTRARREEAFERLLPPVATVRQVSILTPLRLLSVIRGCHDEVVLYCRKSRGQTEYFSAKPEGWGGWCLLTRD